MTSLIDKVNTVICFGVATLACAVTLLGLTGTDPSIRSVTDNYCKYSEAPSAHCKKR